MVTRNLTAKQQSALIFIALALLAAGAFGYMVFLSTEGGVLTGVYAFAGMAYVFISPVAGQIQRAFTWLKQPGEAVRSA